VAEHIWQQREQILTGGRLRSQKLTATVLFSDLHGYTTMSERLNPQTLIDWLNVYMESMSRLVDEHNGIVDKFIGDAIMAVFGVPFSSSTEFEIKRDAQNAVRCALAMERELARLNRVWEVQGLSRAAIRIGIFSGPVVAGSLGSRERMEYTVIGDTVNTASRLESFDKSLATSAPCRILVGASTVQYLDEKFEVVPVGRTRLKGKGEEVLIYLVTGETQALTEDIAKEAVR
jgi:adenylate cyclase